jgi:hypothetical protein
MLALTDQDSDLTPAVNKLKRWAARKRLKGGVKALIALQRMTNLVGAVSAAAASGK